MVGLGDLPGSSFQSRAYATSADGSIVVGISASGFGWEAFSWTAAGGMVGLGVLPDGNSFQGDKTMATSADGSVVVGGSLRSDTGEAFIWDADRGMRSLQDVLIDDLGLDLGGFTQLTDASGISADGMTVVGTGINAAGDTEAFIATIPEPATLWLLAFGGLALVRSRRGHAS
ncbi:MAG: PEP-CTERM sorting domain-containing protein [bacterium]|nr:PEP-CTERM sorting domain-containing protein [bacterium]